MWRASSFDTPGRWARIVSMKWVLTFISGSSRVIGSWKTSAIRSPRRLRRLLAEEPTSSSPSSRTLPRTPAPGGSNWTRPRPSEDLPQPDSPTSPTDSPGATSRSMPSTAHRGPRTVR
jgi:hypothetical protein